MSASAECAVCRSLLEELRNALAEFRASAKSRDESRSAFEAARDLFGGTEEDAERAEQILRQFRPRLVGPDPEYRPNRIGEIIYRMQDHRARTGHQLFGG
jgi:hypothetical protein